MNSPPRRETAGIGEEGSFAEEPMRCLVLLNGTSFGQWVQSPRPCERTGTQVWSMWAFGVVGTLSTASPEAQPSCSVESSPGRGQDAGVEDQGGKGRLQVRCAELKFSVVS